MICCIIDFYCKSLNHDSVLVVQSVFKYLSSHVLTLLVNIFCTVHITPEFIMTTKDTVVKLQVHEIRCTHIHNFEQSELDVIIYSVYCMYIFHMYLCWHFS